MHQQDYRTNKNGVSPLKLIRQLRITLHTGLNLWGTRGNTVYSGTYLTGSIRVSLCVYAPTRVGNIHSGCPSISVHLCVVVMTRNPQELVSGM